MATMTENSVGSSQSSFKAVTLRVVDLPLSVYHSISQVRLSAGTKKLLAISAFSAISLLFLARHLRRRKPKNKVQSPWEQRHFDFLTTEPPEKESSRASSRQNLSLSLNSRSCQSYSHALPSGSLYSKLSSSLQSLTSVKSANSSSSCAYVNSSSPWDKGCEDSDACDIVNIPVTTPENLYLMGMELFEEALRRWEQALTFRSRQAEDEAGCGSVKLGAGDAIAEESVEDIISAEFIHKLEALLQRAYRLQEEFEAALGLSDAASLANDIDKDTDVTVCEDSDELGLRDTMSIASTDSFVSAAELSEHRDLRNAYTLGSLCHYSLYEEALRLAEEGKVSCRVLRTEILECLGDTDFLAKLHCVRQACQVILCDRTTRAFLADAGKKILSSIIIKAHKSPKRFEEVFEEMMNFLEQTDHWENTEVELATRGVKHLNFYDIVLDFILMDSFEDLENPPISIQNVVNNRWLHVSFKETVPDGFIAHFYAICEHISPVLAWGFLGPKSPLHDLCCFFKEQVLFFLKDIFDLEKVRYSSLESLSEDVLQLLQRRTDLLLAYLGADTPCPPTGCIATQSPLLPSALLETRVQ
uniref:Mitoguardin 1 n=1 Tax=Paramormyrops kingsleyae TaxID=1676925 RepID=A0A3B3SA56_9TELE